MKDTVKEYLEALKEEDAVKTVYNKRIAAVQKVLKNLDRAIKVHEKDFKKDSKDMDTETSAYADEMGILYQELTKLTNMFLTKSKVFKVSR